MPHAENAGVGFLSRRKRSKEELVARMKMCTVILEMGGGCLVARPELSISLIPLTHLLRAGADLDGIGNQPSGFLPGDCDDIFKSQRNLSKQRV